MEHLTDRLVGGYSGGNKRKLSLAIAMIGNPFLVLLDGVLGEGEKGRVARGVERRGEGEKGGGLKRRGQS